MADQEKKGTKKISTTNLFVGNIAEKCTEDEIRKMFDKFGQIESVRFFKNASTKPKTKNAIVQYVDSKSVELAFKCKSEMGTDDDSLKISPLKQKRSTATIPNSQPENLEEWASMMMKMLPPPDLEAASSSWKQQFDSINRYGGKSQQGSYHGGFESFEDLHYPGDSPPQPRRHRKSSSVDMLPAPKYGASEYFQKGQKGPFVTGADINLKPEYLGHQRHPHPGMPKSSKKNEFIFPPRPLSRSRRTLPEEPDTDSPPEEGQQPEVESREMSTRARPDSNNYNFVTLIDLYDDDGLSSSFYGKSPAKGNQSLAGDSVSERFED